MTTTRERPRDPEAHPTLRRGSRVAALSGLVARGLLYIVVAVLAVDLAVDRPTPEVGTGSALHQLAESTMGKVLLIVLAVGFGGFALWHAYTAWRGDGNGGSRPLRDAARGVVYGLLCALASSFVVSSRPPASAGAGAEERTWTAEVLGWPGGRLLVGAVGIVLLGAGAYLVWRVLSGRELDEPAVLDAAPREGRVVRALAVAGNVARGAVVGLVGIFIVGAAIEHDPDQTTGVDGALRRLVDTGWGTAAVLAVAVGFAAFGVYSLARAWVNRGQAAERA